MDKGFFGENVKNDDLCSAFTECHQCVAGGCRFDADERKCVETDFGRDGALQVPTFGTFFSNAQVCKDDKNICNQ